MRLLYCHELFLCVTLHIAYVCSAVSQGVLDADEVLSHAPITFLSSWDVLGPFRLGTREAVWGADPVEFYGGIQLLSSSDKALYRSPLTAGATVRWSNRTFATVASDAGTSVEVAVDFPDVDWQFFQRIYGWSSLQFQGWVKGVIWNADTAFRRVVLQPKNVLELWINDDHVFGGDFYGFQRAPVVVDLRPGSNDISIRLTGDIRSMGGISPPVFRATLSTHVVSAPLGILNHSLVIPDVVSGRFCTHVGSITVSNHANSWVEVRHVTATVPGKSVDVLEESIRIAPGQSRPLQMNLTSLDSLGEALELKVLYTVRPAAHHQITFHIPLTHVSNTSTQKITFLHPSGAVSYATLRPPPTMSEQVCNKSYPVLLNLHGAGVDTDGPLSRHIFDAAHDLPVWILSPSGMSPWSGDDWHTWGFADIEAALLAIPQWMEHVSWRGAGFTSGQMLIAGHSNGGQGTWFFASHQPDRVLGAAVASGYSSIENYVPYMLWTEADPLQARILETSRNSFRHELLAENLAGIPIFQQHGSEDDNVPAYHSRLMNTLLAQAGQVVNYTELQGRGHWFTGVMTTEPMMQFYLDCLNGSNFRATAPAEFAFVAPNSHDLGSKYGILIDQLMTPDKLGKITVTTNVNDSSNRWHIQTENVRRLHVDFSGRISNPPDEILLDNMPYLFRTDVVTEDVSFVKSESNVWSKSADQGWRNIEQRCGRQRGFLDSILRTAGVVEIIYCSNDALPLAIQISRNFLQYYGADSNILPCPKYKEALKREGNIIVVGSGHTTPPAHLASFPVQLGQSSLSLRLRTGGTARIPLTPGMGGVWLRPLPDERLELIVWGHDEVGTRQAARLVPTLTGAGQPDFVILKNEARWKGSSGTAALGFFDYKWSISSASFLP
ncbi:hypothetical protein HRR90_007850 [Exophiala dermatitidis]|nr:hypothetical protein HRR75_008417 [Exophiala dermatitidis]KAJ4508194.1 hypothetical protein HRR73_007633 [Exophiala dermatitidis]KAJ4537852.1 hypothetical protein HRR78_008444 [Exophiala dermatitidis]KAJ4540107.1 hypothetical protein HRR76_003524 [Exophiala dermatitidis]KAJ4561625.1 hypothetical protein HRR81_009324 [Exophiala dermatitidis]